MIERDFAALIESLAIAGAYIASRDGQILIQAGAFPDATFGGLKTAPEGYNPWLPLDATEVSSIWSFLEGKIVPQTAAQGESRVCLMKPIGKFIGLAAYIVPLGVGSAAQRAVHSYNWAKRIANAFDVFAEAHKKELTNCCTRHAKTHAREQ